MKEKIKLINKLSQKINLLYVEDNLGLSKNMHTLLSKVVDGVIIANDGKEGYQKFLKHEPKIIITDINMPEMNGFEMITKILAVEPECKIIILSALDEKEHLHKAINLGVCRYLKKPAKVPDLIDALYDTVAAIHKDENRRLFLNQLQNIINYQNSIVVMMYEGKFILPNQRFLEFFQVDTLKDFYIKYNIDDLLLPHQEFLYTQDGVPWYKTAEKNPGKLFHTKMENSQGEKRHLILKLREVPEKEGHGILSFDDVTELNLLALFDSQAVKNDNEEQDKKAVLSFMEIVKNNASQVKIHNYYKGLTIVNPGVIVAITEDDFTLKTTNSQLKVVQLTKFTTISSEIFPKNVVCKAIKQVDIEKQTITISDMHFSLITGNDRRFIRLEATPDVKCALYYKQIQLSTETRVIDISQVSVKIEINALPAGISIDDFINMRLTIKANSKLSSIQVESKLYRIDENKRSYYLVLLFKLPSKEEEILKNYIALRQMELIREFKNLNIT